MLRNVENDRIQRNKRTMNTKKTKVATNKMWEKKIFTENTKVKNMDHLVAHWLEKVVFSPPAEVYVPRLQFCVSVLWLSSSSCWGMTEPMSSGRPVCLHLRSWTVMPRPIREGISLTRSTGRDGSASPTLLLEARRSCSR